DRIFSHTGIDTLFEVSRTIEKTIEKEWGPHNPRYTLSLKEYAVIIIQKKGEQPPAPLKKPYFSFRNIPLPSTSAFIPLNGSDAFYRFTDALFSLADKKKPEENPPCSR
ncbi:MAG: hypothetical protein ACRCUT_02925, partial [Spirochaetota bacterium]